MIVAESEIGDEKSKVFSAKSGFAFVLLQIIDFYTLVSLQIVDCFTLVLLQIKCIFAPNKLTNI
jgi:hypothetical protein